MTYAAYPGLAQPEFAAWREKILSPRYDKRPLPSREDRREHRLRHDREAGRLGPAPDADHRAFRRRPPARAACTCSPATSGSSRCRQSDGFFTLARADAGVSCFFVPGFLPDGSRNAIRIQRLKDKCGNRSNASSEIEYHDALAWLVGEEGHGIREILSMPT